MLIPEFGILRPVPQMKEVDNKAWPGTQVQSHDEVDSRVSNMSETTNNCVGSEIYAMVHAFKNIVNMENVGCNAQE